MPSMPNGLAKIIGSFGGHKEGNLDPEVSAIGDEGVAFVHALEAKYKLKTGAITQVHLYPDHLGFGGENFTINIDTKPPFEEEMDWENED